MLLVVAEHYAIPGVLGGWIGVDIFLDISGVGRPAPTAQAIDRVWTGATEETPRSPNQ